MGVTVARDVPLQEAQLASLEAGERFLAEADPCQSQGVLAVVETLLYLSDRSGKASSALGALYAYRALELLLEERLCAHLGRRADHPALAPEEEALKGELASILRTAPEEVRLGPKLGLLDLVAFLRSQGDPLLSRVRLGELQGLSGVLKARNESLLVHGFRVPSRKETGSIQTLARPLLQDLQERLGLRVPVKPVELGQAL